MISKELKLEAWEEPTPLVKLETVIQCMYGKQGKWWAEYKKEPNWWLIRFLLRCN